MNLQSFSFIRMWSILKKELLQLRRDRITFIIIIALPILEMALFGFAINDNPKHMPTAVIAADNSEFTRSFLAAMENSQYFEIVATLPDEASAERALMRGDVQFVISIPSGFSRDLLKGKRPSILIEADATDPTAVGPALGQVKEIAKTALSRDLSGPLAVLSATPMAFDVNIHRRFNPASITVYNTIPGLIGMILTSTMMTMTGLSITRERERGTMENLLATPLLPLEVMTGKIVPYIVIGMLQVAMILWGARYVFGVPFHGSLFAMYLCALLFSAANLTAGIALSSIAQSQLQAVQLTNFYFLPNILLSGFLFPFSGMPQWAQMLGNLLPITHFNRVVRAILLKGVGWTDLFTLAWPLVIFLLVTTGAAMLSYRRTLD